MAAANVLNLTEATWATEVDASTIPVLVDFWAPWCGPCRRLAPTIDAIATKYEGKVKVAKLNTDEAQTLAGNFNISGIPCVIIFKNGKEAQRLVGLLTEGEYSKALDRLL